LIELFSVLKLNIQMSQLCQSIWNKEFFKLIDFIST